MESQPVEGLGVWTEHKNPPFNIEGQNFKERKFNTLLVRQGNRQSCISCILSKKSCCLGLSVPNVDKVYSIGDKR